MERVQHCMQTGVSVSCSWAMVKMLCQMLSGAECCDLNGEKLATDKLQLTCYLRCVSSLPVCFILMSLSGYVP
jgi:hypothetical protein